MAKHFVNDPTALVTSALRSVSLLNPDVAVDEANKIIYRRPSSTSRTPQVSILSGGGSGHEPSFSGMVGQGMLSAAVAGSIFASPSAEQIRTGILSRIDRSRGALVVVMNYTGDVLNFGMAVEKARAQGPVEMVVVGDDVGVGRARAGKVGRRGIAGTVLVVKIAGALAARGRRLEEVAKVARLTAENLVSVGASLGHVHVPGREEDDYDELAGGKVEIGMGIHNEPGSGREKMMGLGTLVTKMLAQLLDRGDEDRAFLNVNSNEVVLLLNNLGGVSPLEMGAIATEVVAQLADGYGVRPVRVLSGTYMTSLDGPGFSITLLNVVNTDIGGPGMIELLDDPAEVTGWSAPVRKETWEAKNTAVMEEVPSSEKETVRSGLMWDARVAEAALERGLKAVVDAEPDITRYDTVVGDGDCGVGLKRGAQAILEHVKEHPFKGDVVADLSSIVPVVENTMDGTSGALYAIFINALVNSLLSSEKETKISVGTWAAALKKSCDALSRYTPARPGDRTLIDALHPFVEKLEKTGDVKPAASAAAKAAEATKGMEPSLGRSVYVGGSGYKEVPDPGAYGLACFFLGLAGVEQTITDDWEAV